jgi:hypothetical protein
VVLVGLHLVTVAALVATKIMVGLAEEAEAQELLAKTHLAAEQAVLVETAVQILFVLVLLYSMQQAAEVAGLLVTEQVELLA